MDLLPRLKTATQVAMNPEKHISDVLSDLCSSVDDVLLIGFADKMDDERFYVSTVAGEQSGHFKGFEFFVGEGFLGHVVATAQPSYWSNVAKDPRTDLFVRNGVHPASVFCYPVFKRQEVHGVLFGALSAEAQEDTLTFLELISIMLGRQLHMDSLEEKLQVNTARIEVLIELTQAIQTIEDIKNIFYVILDMSMNLVQGSFSCIAFQPVYQESAVELITRGLPRRKAAEYGRQLVASYIGLTMADFKNQVVPVIRNLETVSVIECPIFAKNKVIAVLAVAVDKESVLDEFTQLVYVLSIIGGGAVQRSYRDNADDWLREISLIQKVSEFWSKEVHEHATRMQELATEFTKKLGWCDVSVRDICDAAPLTPYNIGFIEETLSNIPNAVCQILYDYRKVVDCVTADGSEPGEAGQILAMVDYHVSNMPIQTDSISPKLRQQFEKFLLQRQIEYQQIQLDSGRKSVQTEGSPLLELPIVKQLTRREQDVLELLVTGKGNKEIAQTLYISEHTVKNHMTNIFYKLGVADRTQAITYVLTQLQ